MFYLTDRFNLESIKESVEKLKGTTTLGVRCVDGVVIASDKRATTGTYVASKAAVKTLKVSDRIVATISGLVADGQKLVEWTKAEVSLYSLELEKPPMVKTVAEFMGIILFSVRPYLLISQLIVAGLDYVGGHIFNVDPFGMVSEEDYFATGSGSPLAISVLDSGYDEKIRVEDGLLLAVKAMKSALSRDSATGDGIDLTVVDKKGVRFLPKEKIQKLIEGV